MQKQSITWQMLDSLKNQNEDDVVAKPLKDDQQLSANLKQNQVLQLCTVFMSIIINNFMSTSDIVLAK